MKKYLYFSLLSTALMTTALTSQSLAGRDFANIADEDAFIANRMQKFYDKHSANLSSEEEENQVMEAIMASIQEKKQVDGNRFQEDEALAQAIAASLASFQEEDLRLAEAPYLQDQRLSNQEDDDLQLAMALSLSLEDQKLRDQHEDKPKPVEDKKNAEKPIIGEKNKGDHKTLCEEIKRVNLRKASPSSEKAEQRPQNPVLAAIKEGGAHVLKTVVRPVEKIGVELGKVADTVASGIKTHFNPLNVFQGVKPESNNNVVVNNDKVKAAHAGFKDKISKRAKKMVGTFNENIEKGKGQLKKAAEPVKKVFSPLINFGKGLKKTNGFAEAEARRAEAGAAAGLGHVKNK